MVPLSVGEVHSALQAQFSKWGDIAVHGELTSTRRRGNALYAELLQKDENNRIEAKLNIVIFGLKLSQIDQVLRAASLELADGLPFLFRGALTTFGPSGALQLSVNAVDPTWTIGQSAVNKDLLLQKLQQEGVLHANRRIPFPPLPMRIAVIVGEKSAAEADFRKELEDSLIDFKLLIVPAVVQGDGAVSSIQNAFSAIYKSKWSPDVVALVRGGGSKSDLAAFDQESIARMIAVSPWPVITGIGHEIDYSVADAAAHKSFKTPTATAAALVDQIRRFHSQVELRFNNTLQNVLRTLNARQEQLVRAGMILERAGNNLSARTERELTKAESRLQRIDGRLQQELALTDRRAVRLKTGTEEFFTRTLHALERAELQVEKHDTTKLLQRGFSILTQDGEVVSASSVDASKPFTARTKDGIITAQVQSSKIEVSAVDTMSTSETDAKGSEKE